MNIHLVTFPNGISRMPILNQRSIDNVFPCCTAVRCPTPAISCPKCRSFYQLFGARLFRTSTSRSDWMGDSQIFCVLLFDLVISTYSVDMSQASGYPLVMTNVAIENGPVEIKWICPVNSMVDLSSSLCENLPGRVIPIFWYFLLFFRVKITSNALNGVRLKKMGAVVRNPTVPWGNPVGTTFWMERMGWLAG